MSGIVPEVSQTLADIVISASLYVLIGIGFGIVLQVGRFFHLAHGAIFTGGAYGTWLLLKCAGFPAWAAFPLGILLSGAMGPLLWYSVYRHIAKRAGGPLALLLASLGAYIIMQNAFSLLFGDATLQIRSAYWSSVLLVGQACVTRAQIGLVLLGSGCYLGLGFLLRDSRIGRDMRAVGDDPALAATVGIDAERTVVWAFLAASLVAGAAGLFVALDVDLRPTMGFQPLLLGICASVLGGIGRLRGLLLAAVALALVEHLGAWLVPVYWSESLALIGLVIALIWRPCGLLASKRRAA